MSSYIRKVPPRPTSNILGTRCPCMLHRCSGAGTAEYALQCILGADNTSCAFHCDSCKWCRSWCMVTMPDSCCYKSVAELLKQHPACCTHIAPEDCSSWRRNGFDIFTAGFPCQQFSKMNPNRFTKGKSPWSDKRTDVLGEIVEFLNKGTPDTLPKLVVLENTGGIDMRKKGAQTKQTPLTQIVKRFKQLKYYHVDHRKILASSFGLPQDRARYYFMMVRNDVSDGNGRLGQDLCCEGWHSIDIRARSRFEVASFQHSAHVARRFIFCGCVAQLLWARRPRHTSQAIFRRSSVCWLIGPSGSQAGVAMCAHCR